jgi:hypothetical protein
VTYEPRSDPLNEQSNNPTDPGGYTAATSMATTSLSSFLDGQCIKIVTVLG